MKVLMFGWEFAPIYSGGLGVACAGLTKGLVKNNVEVTFIIPKKTGDIQTHVNLVSAAEMMENVTTFQQICINSPLMPYMNSESYQKAFGQNFTAARKNEGSESLYGQNLFEEVHRYAEAAIKIAEQETFDVIHAHDWMTYKAGINAKKVSGKPLVLHIHNTAFDRSGGHPSQQEYDIEKHGFHSADKIIAVSNYTKNMVTKHYGVHPDKVDVVHNAVDFDDHYVDAPRISEKDKIVLFLGRITLQKGPDYFVEMARKVADMIPEAKFVVAGSGDMEARMILRAAELGLGDKMLFAGFLKGDDITRAYKMADVYVMPSVSEPFGITPLESIKNGTPVVISKTSGVSEVVSNAIKVDFWDIDRMANMVAGILKYAPLKETMTEEGLRELQKISWDNSAMKCIDVYNQVMK